MVPHNWPLTVTLVPAILLPQQSCLFLILTDSINAGPPLNEAFQKFPTPLAAMEVLLAPGWRHQSALYDPAEYGLFIDGFSRVILDDAPLAEMLLDEVEEVEVEVEPDEPV
jgi:hypothetical protein